MDDSNVIYLSPEKLRNVRGLNLPDVGVIKVDASLMSAYQAGWFSDHPGNAPIKGNCAETDGDCA